MLLIFHEFFLNYITHRKTILMLLPYHILNSKNTLQSLGQLAFFCRLRLHLIAMKEKALIVHHYGETHIWKNQQNL